MRRRIGLLTAIACLTAQAASACSFDGFPIPTSIVDRLIGSNQIVLTRPDPDEVLRFTITEVVEGDPGTSQVPLTLSAIERKRLEANPDDMVMFARAGAFSNWQRIGYVPARHHDLFGRIADRLPDWRREADLDRAATFAPYADDDDPLIRTAALVELGRQQYADLRMLDHARDAGALMERLDVLSEQYLVPIRLQLIGLSKDRAALGSLENRLAGAVQANDPNLRHYATAYIELGGAGAVEAVSREYLTDTSLSLDAKRKIMDAIGLHQREGDPRLRVMLQWAVQQAQVTAPGLRPTGMGRFHGSLRQRLSTPVAVSTGSGQG